MAHRRTTIRAALKTLLVSTTDAGANVYSNRPTPLWQSELPAIMIYVENETSVPRALSSVQSIRTLTARIEIQAEANTNVDSTLDAIALQVENILETNRNISGNALTSILTGTEMSLDSDGEKILGRAILTYEIKYIE